MLRLSSVMQSSGRKWWREGSPNFTRANARRSLLERKRFEASRYLSPVEPTPSQACSLYLRFLKESEKRLLVSDKNFFRRKVRSEMEVTARQTSARVRGIMYEKGKWMLENELGGVV